MNQQNLDVPKQVTHKAPKQLTKTPVSLLNLIKEMVSLEKTSHSQQSESTQNVSIPINEPSKDQPIPIDKKIQKEQQIKQQSNNFGHWTVEEHQAYLEFITKKNLEQAQQDNKYISKFFKLMSQTIGTRTPQQCKSHHQKFNPNTKIGQQKINNNQEKLNIFQQNNQQMN